MTAICVCNYSGNVGKTTIAVQLLAAFSGFPVLSVETFNVGAKDGSVRVVDADERRVVDALERGLDCIIDLGSANLREMIAAFSDFDGAGSDIDLWVIPVTADAKVIKDTLATAQHIIEVGAHADRIVFVPNIVKVTSNYESYFNDFVEQAAQIGASVCPLIIYESDVFDQDELLAEKTMRDWADDSTDYRLVARDNSLSDEVRDNAVRRSMMARQCRSTVARLEEAFESIMSAAR